MDELAGAKELAEGTGRLPHPYPKGGGASWIARHKPAWRSGEFATWAICLRTGEVIGAMTLHLVNEHRQAELGFWVGMPYWNQGYCTEAAREAVRFGFEVLGLNRIQSRHFAWNLASGRVMQNVGMRHEGVFREDFFKGDRFEDTVFYSILAREFFHR